MIQHGFTLFLSVFPVLAEFVMFFVLGAIIFAWDVSGMRTSRNRLSDLLVVEGYQLLNSSLIILYSGVRGTLNSITASPSDATIYKYKTSEELALLCSYTPLGTVIIINREVDDEGLYWEPH